LLVAHPLCGKHVQLKFTDSPVIETEGGDFISKKNTNQFPDHLPRATSDFKRVAGANRFKIFKALTGSNHNRFALDF
jgi:hypothetical protein